MLVANRARRAVLEGIEYGHPDPHLAGRLAQHLPQLSSPQHADDRVGDAMHRLVAMPTSTTHQKKKIQSGENPAAAPTNDTEIATNSKTSREKRALTPREEEKDAWRRWRAAAIEAAAAEESDASVYSSAVLKASLLFSLEIFSFLKIYFYLLDSIVPVHTGCLLYSIFLTSLIFHIHLS